MSYQFVILLGNPFLIMHVIYNVRIGVSLASSDVIYWRIGSETYKLKINLIMPL